MVKIINRKTQGNGKFNKNDFNKIGKNVIFENDVLVFHPENIIIGDGVYVGHQTILKGYYKNMMIIKSGTWIGQQCLIHSAGGVIINENVGIGPGVKIFSSVHNINDIKKPIIHSRLIFKKVIIGKDSDIGTNAVIMPGVKIGQGVQIGAGAVVTKNVPDFEIWTGVPARHRAKRG